MKNVFYKYGRGVNKMRVYNVTQLNKVKPSLYIEGDLFLTKQSIGILHNGKMDTLVKQSDVKKMIQREIKKVLKDEK